MTIGILRDVLVPRNEIVHPRDKPSGQAIFVGLEHIEPHTGKRIGSLPVDLATLNGRKARFCTGDIVYGYLRPYLNKVWLAEFDGYCSVDQYVFRVRETADARYVALFMRSPTYLETAPVSYTPGQLPRIRTDEVLSVAIPLPAVDEQRAIAKRLDEQLDAVEKLRRATVDQLTLIDSMPAAVLRREFAR